ncbi:hypothetical protein ACQPZ2_38650 [Nocardia pseudovaccinii]|uniref:hypothetical protein n=1 Tax=Nocardia pseudovaccinii TaxID=189540 RepID=UPI003D92C7C5
MNSQAVRQWCTAGVDRISRWCEISAGAWTTVEAPTVTTGMRDAVVAAAVIEFGSPLRPNVAGGGYRISPHSRTPARYWNSA